MTSSGRVRLQKAISASGLMSRRRAEDLIREGRVSIEGRIAVLGDRVDPHAERVEIDGEPIPVAPGLVTYLCYKPVGVQSTASDPRGRETVVELVPAKPRVWPVGRLDADTEGLLLVSNDGLLTNLVTHPRHGVPKTYLAWFDGVPSRSDLRRLTQGVELEDGPASAVSAKLVDRRRGQALVEIVMTEGRNREVRRMVEAIGFQVVRLVRTAIGPIADRSLAPGSWRELTVSEVAELYRSAVRGSPSG